MRVACFLLFCYHSIALPKGLLDMYLTVLENVTSVVSVCLINDNQQRYRHLQSVLLVADNDRV